MGKALLWSRVTTGWVAGRVASLIRWRETRLVRWNEARLVRWRVGCLTRCWIALLGGRVARLGCPRGIARLCRWIPRLARWEARLWVNSHR